ncbi:MAG TPA: hypothetical protein PK231_03905, partial [Acidocella sp.]|nr:hypothetical protein [Acidocella sp.]
GVISAQTTAILNNAGQSGTFTNSGLIAGTQHIGINNAVGSTLAAIINSSIISGVAAAISNNGVIGLVSNQHGAQIIGSIAGGTTSNGIFGTGTINVLSNSGSIIGVGT